MDARLIAAARACAAEIERRRAGGLGGAEVVQAPAAMPRAMIGGDLWAGAPDCWRAAFGQGSIFDRLVFTAHLTEAGRAAQLCKLDGSRITGRNISHVFDDERYFLDAPRREIRTSRTPAEPKRAVRGFHGVGESGPDISNAWLPAKIINAAIDPSLGPDMTASIAPCGCSQQITADATLYRYCADHGPGRLAAMKARG